jgi:tRNA pseudouridine55 synthase
MSLNPGFIVVAKEAGITSHDVVAMLRAVTGIKKVGHTGTLDPFACGVLPLALGGATRLIQHLDESQKVYDATIALGAATDTGDPTGAVIEEQPVPAFERADVDALLEGFLGDRMQKPHRYSAVKVKGKRLYEYARKGETVEVEARPIHIYALDAIELSEHSLRVELTCSRGTYARGLADEIASGLGTVGHLSALTRLRSGPFDMSRALTLGALSEIVAETPDWTRALRRQRGEDRVPWLPREQVFAGLEPYVYRPIDALAHLPLLPVSAGVAEAVLRGGAVPPPPVGVRTGERYLIVAGEQLLGLAESLGGGQAKVLWRGSQPSR